jgi:hypothetical protein
MRNRQASSAARTVASSSGTAALPTRTTVARLLALLVASIPSLAASAADDPSHRDQPDDGFYALCSDLVPAWVQEKHLAGIPSQTGNLSEEGTDCIYSNGQRRVDLVYNCIRGHTFQRRALDPATEKEIPSLGRFSYQSMRPAGPAVVVVDDDTPCAINLNSKGGWTAEALVPLARDLVKTLTPQALNRATVEGLVWATDESGTSGEDRMAVWQREGASVASIFTLPAGFPQVAELPPRVAGGKPRKTLVLGYLAHRSRYVFVAEAASVFLPGIDVERFPAEGHKPAKPPAMLNLGTTKDSTVGPGKQHLVVAFANSGQDKYADDLLIVFLRDASQRLLDWRKINILTEAPDTANMLDHNRPQEEHRPQCEWEMKKSSNGIVARVDCELNPDPSSGTIACKKNPSWTLRWDIGVKDDKLRIQRKVISFAGKACFLEGE